MATPRWTRRRGSIERAWREAGRTVAGIDEVGRGSIAGPVTAGCAVLDYDRLARLKAKDRQLIRDSKLLTTVQRQYVVPIIKSICRDWQVAEASVAEIEQLGIVQATFLAMRRTLQACLAPFDLLLVDGKWPITDYGGEQQTIIKGDNLCFAIAAASILAKESRDDFMRSQSEAFPAYGFAEHVGYGTQQHVAKIREHGVCSLHRRNFDPIRSLIHPNSSKPAHSSLQELSEGG